MLLHDGRDLARVGFQSSPKLVTQALDPINFLDVSFLNLCLLRFVNLAIVSKTLLDKDLEIFDLVLSPEHQDMLDV